MTNERARYSDSVLAEKVNRLENEVREIRADVNRNKSKVNDISADHKLLAYKLDEISKDLSEVREVVNRDSGWRGFFIDFIKAAAQIAALIGAGKFFF